MQESECGGRKWKASPHRKTGEKSNKIFSMAMGNLAPGNDVLELLSVWGQDSFLYFDFLIHKWCVIERRG